MSQVHSLQDYATDIRCNGVSLERVTKYKLLGVTFDQDMTWNEHITQLISSCHSALSVIRKLQHIASYHTRKQVAETLILSKIDYCNSIYSTIPEYQKKRLQRVQNCCASFVSKRYAKIDDVKELGWLPIGKRLELSILKLAHKALHNSDWPAYLRLRVFKSSYNLRSLTSLRIDCARVNELNTRPSSKIFQCIASRYSLHN